MKLIIDIPKVMYVNAKRDLLFGADILVKAIKNGTPLDVIDELEKVSGKTLEEMLACFASEDIEPVFQCDDCPLRLKGICAPTHFGITCYELWLNYLKSNKNNS